MSPQALFHSDYSQNLFLADRPHVGGRGELSELSQCVQTGRVPAAHASRIEAQSRNYPNGRDYMQAAGLICPYTPATSTRLSELVFFLSLLFGTFAATDKRHSLPRFKGAKRSKNDRNKEDI